jgi:hypothetical protein
MQQHGAIGAANRIRDKAKGRAKVDTGFMRASTTSSGDGMHAETRCGAHYGGYLNWGTRYIAADHWFDGPVEEERGAWPAAMGPALGAAYEGAA